MGVYGNGALFRRKVKKAEGKSWLDAGRRERRGGTQAELANRLNKAVSTSSGYESDAHAIPLDVLASISSLFSISTDELLGLDAPEVLSLSGLTGAQKKTLIKLRNELLSPSQKGNDLSPQQMEILHDIIKAFG